MATPAGLPAIERAEPRRLTHYHGLGGFPLGARAQLVLGTLLVSACAYPLSIVPRLLAGERIPGVHTGPGVLLSVVVLFGGLGLAFLRGGVMAVATRAWAASRMRRLPDQPWLADYPWERRGGRDLAPRELGRAIALAGVLWLFATIFSWAGFVARSGALFQVFGGLLVVGALVASRRALGVAWRTLRWGRSRLRFADFPCAPGGTLEVIFDDLAPAVRGLPLQATLRCVQERWETRDTQRGERRTDLVHWELWRELVEVPPGARSARFTLPAGAPGTALGDRPARWWELELVVARPKTEWRARFLVPVYTNA